MVQAVCCAGKLRPREVSKDTQSSPREASGGSQERGKPEVLPKETEFVEAVEAEKTSFQTNPPCQTLML